MNEVIIVTARQLRKNQTDAESYFWEKVRSKRLEGKKFLRQYPMKFLIDDVQRYFIADFYCSEFKLVIELDGKIHDQQKEYDELRDYIMNTSNITVLRFSNNKILQNIDNVLTKILNFFNEYKRA
jgi:very-short-patch-repair endonuclease